LAQFAAARIPEFKLLRIYWYDGSGGLRPTIEQEQLARLDNVKVRLGLINSAGQQKGVDSLIVTDLIELARLGAICDAVLLSGDEDVRVGVQIAQNYGVRIHLLGIEPSRGSQSKALLQEADTTSEWTKATVAKFLSIRSSPAKPDSVSPVAVALPLKELHAPSNSDVPADRSVAQQIASTTDDFVKKLSDGDEKSLLVYWKTHGRIAPEFDGRLLTRCRSEIQRNLDVTEKRLVRSKFVDALHARADADKEKANRGKGK
jgi:hypothetical protein